MIIKIIIFFHNHAKQLATDYVNATLQQIRKVSQSLARSCEVDIEAAALREPCECLAVLRERSIDITLFAVLVYEESIYDICTFSRYRGIRRVLEIFGWGRSCWCRLRSYSAPTRQDCDANLISGACSFVFRCNKMEEPHSLGLLFGATHPGCWSFDAYRCSRWRRLLSEQDYARLPELLVFLLPVVAITCLLPSRPHALQRSPSHLLWWICYPSCDNVGVQYDLVRHKPSLHSSNCFNGGNALCRDRSASKRKQPTTRRP